MAAGVGAVGVALGGGAGPSAAGLGSRNPLRVLSPPAHAWLTMVAHSARMKRTLTTLAALPTAALLVLAAPAHASHGGDDDRVIKTGSCSAGADWKLKVKTDDGRLEVEGEVDTNQSGQSWKWKIKDNGAVAAKGTATTGGRSGSFSVERKITNQAGTDTVIFRAKHNGQVCTGTIAF